MFLGCYELWMLRFWMLRILDATALDALIVSRICSQNTSVKLAASSEERTAEYSGIS